MRLKKTSIKVNFDQIKGGQLKIGGIRKPPFGNLRTKDLGKNWQ